MPPSSAPTSSSTVTGPDQGAGGGRQHATQARRVQPDTCPAHLGPWTERPSHHLADPSAMAALEMPAKSLPERAQAPMHA